MRTPFENPNEVRKLQELFKQHNLYWIPVEREHVEAGIIEPYEQQLRLLRKRYTMKNLIGKVFITFSGYGYDPREIWQIPEIKAWYQKFDFWVDELPAVLGVFPPARYNGPGQHLQLLGEIDRFIAVPEEQRYLTHVVDAERILENAARHIRHTYRKYRLGDASERIAEFKRGALAE